MLRTGHKDFLDYDAEHHLIRQRDHQLNEVGITYRPDGLVDTVTGPRLTVTDQSYDANGFLDMVQTGTHPAIDWDSTARGHLLSYWPGTDVLATSYAGKCC
ncbi:MAG: hypothetical protein U5K56_19810 [Halioglobus sp.]|nr:hypothetical protein [Halioglobus sp.]